jgi:hypothetical protein
VFSIRRYPTPIITSGATLMNIRNVDFPVRRHSVWLMAVGLAAALLSGQAQAYGRDTGGTNPPPPKPTCPKGQVYDTHSKSCVDQQK